MGAPEIAARDALVERWFDNGVPDGADVSAPLFGPAESEQLFQTLTLDELLSARDPKFLVDRHLPERSLGFLYGEPGAKKSFIALDWALHLAFGKPDWHGDTISAKPDGVVLYLAGEGAFGMKARAEAWLQRHEIPSDQRSAGRFYLLPHSVDMMKADQVGKLASTLRRGIAKPVIAIIVDTVSRSMPGADENLQKDMTLFVRACDRLKEEFDCTVLGVHHASKSGALRGSSVLAGAGDFVFRMDCKKGALAGKLHCEKQKDAPDGWADAYRFDVIYLSDGRSSLVPARAAQEGAAVSPEVTGRIFDAMRVAWDAGEPWAKSMHKSGERGAVRRIVSDFGIDADHAAMLLDLWERTGEIIEEIFDNRNKRRGYRVAEVDVEEADDVLE
jgi:hypothetical protein